jgi:glycosyltransferase involved in cell wall biosynthesis
LPNGLNLDDWKPREKTFIVGFCGNISGAKYRQYKGYDYVEEACNNLGVGLRTALYKDQQIPHDRMMQDFYYQINCIVHPTLGEGCSNTLMEACACGVPIITTREAGFHGELMQDGVNVLFCERSTQSIQDKLSLLMHDVELRARLSANARQFAIDNHDIKIIAKKYDDIFQDCYNYNNTTISSITEVINAVDVPIQRRKHQKVHRIWKNGKILHE